VFAVTDIFSRDTVFPELVHQRARENVVEEQTHVRGNRALRRLLPSRAPKNGEDFDGSEQRPAAVSELGRGCRCDPLRLRPMEWHDPDRVLQRSGGFLGMGLGGHAGLLARAAEFAIGGLRVPTGWNSHGSGRLGKCKWDFAQVAGAAGIYSGSECGIVPTRTRGDSMGGPIKVEIFGQVYSIQGELDAKYVQKLAKYLDEKMQAIADATKTVDTQKVAVLTALAIADELHSVQRERNDREELLSEQAERCLTLVERALKQTA